ncbi:DUF1491 family protein [Polymorphobacter sp.]|uniref:DUF1491 family protein n=1 Tax=Polymorphobacter sp. TaxID=1909290 RepID=UPI003F6FF60A
MRLAAGLKVSALLRTVEAAGGFGAVLARGDATAGSIAVVSRTRGQEDVLLTPVMAASGGYAYQETARGEAIAAWTERARRRDPDLWIIELDIPDAARFIADSLTGD